MNYSKNCIKNGILIAKFSDVTSRIIDKTNKCKKNGRIQHWLHDIEPYFLFTIQTLYPIGEHYESIIHSMKRYKIIAQTIDYSKRNLLCSTFKIFKFKSKQKLSIVIATNNTDICLFDRKDVTFMLPKPNW